MITHEEVGRRIRQAREAVGMSQSDFGRLLTRPRSYAAISDIERGKTKIDIEELAEFARLLQQDLAYFTEATPPAKSTASVVYRRGDRGLTGEQQREADKALEAFKQLAREQASKRPKG